MIKRRPFLSASVGVGLCNAVIPQLVGSASGEETSPAVSGPNLFGFLTPEEDPEFGPIITGEKKSGAVTVSAGASRHDEVATAFRILFDVDRANGPLGAARYFESVAQKNSEGESYNREWLKRANPVIVGFFSMTNTLPSDGDQTSWCAAFVNFCLYVASKRTTFSALSGSFRKYGEATSSPEPGDIVVFSKYGEDGKKGFGHVGFFVARSGSEVTVLGGNQRGTTGSTGAVTTANFPVEGKSLILASFRRVQSI